MNETVKLVIWVAVIGVLFLVLWRKGYLLQLSNYVAETKEELRKCTWPTVAELKGSTLLVMVAIIMLGIFTMIADQVILVVLRALDHLN